MNILFVITRADAIGGAQVHVKDLAVALQQDKHKVIVLTGQKGAYNQVLEAAGIESVACEALHRKINPFGDGKSLRYLLHIIDLFKPDLIAAHSSKAGILGRLAGRISKVPCTFTAHGWSFTPGIAQPSRSIYQWLEKSAAPLTSKIICVSEYDRQIAIKAGINSQKLCTVHNGMKDIATELRTEPESALNSSAPVKVAMIARFDKQKDHATLIQAFQGLNAELILVGDGVNLPKVRQQVNKLGLEKQVRFLGFRQDIANILAEVQIFTLVSNWEGLPCTIIEAMRAGLPVVASDVGGVAEIVLEKETGFVIPRGDVDVLHQKLAYLIDNGKVRQDMGKLARLKYESQLTFEHMYQKTISIYQEAIALSNDQRR